MNQQSVLLGQAIIILTALGLFSATVFALRHAFQRLQVSRKRERQLLGFSMGGLALWLAILALLSFQGFFLNFEGKPPRLALMILIPLVVTIALFFSRDFRLVLHAIPPAWLVYVQSFRIVMELFLWQGYRGGYVPPQMTFEWLNYDIVVGLTAPMAGYVFFGNRRFFRFQGLLWNFFGIALLLNIIVISLLSTPSPMRVFFNEPANEFVAYFPFSWIPGFIVPFALAMHLFSIRQLLFTYIPERRFQLRRRDDSRTKDS